MNCHVRLLKLIVWTWWRKKMPDSFTNVAPHYFPITVMWVWTSSGYLSSVIFSVVLMKYFLWWNMKYFHTSISTIRYVECVFCLHWNKAFFTIKKGYTKYLLYLLLYVIELELQFELIVHYLRLRLLLVEKKKLSDLIEVLFHAFRPLGIVSQIHERKKKVNQCWSFNIQQNLWRHNQSRIALSKPSSFTSSAWEIPQTASLAKPLNE